MYLFIYFIVYLAHDGVRLQAAAPGGLQHGVMIVIIKIIIIHIN